MTKAQIQKRIVEGIKEFISDSDSCADPESSEGVQLRQRFLFS